MAYMGGWTGEGRAQAAGADGRWAQTSCVQGRGHGQAKIAMSYQGRGLQGGRTGKAFPPQSGVTACTVYFLLKKRSKISLMLVCQTEEVSYNKHNIL